MKKKELIELLSELTEDTDIGIIEGARPLRGKIIPVGGINYDEKEKLAVILTKEFMDTLTPEDRVYNEHD